MKQQEDPDTEYVLDMVKMNSPSKDKDALKHSKRTLKDARENPVLHNDIRGQDLSFDDMWEQNVHGLNTYEE